MRDFSIISKGKYTYGQTNEFLHIERFLVVRKKKRRILLLDLDNRSKETLTALTLRIEQYDARGNALGTVDAALKKLAQKSGKFVLKKEIDLHRSCIDFRAQVLCAEYGDYSYRLGENDTYVTYEKKIPKAEVDTKAIENELGKEGFSAKKRRHRIPLFVSVFAAIVLVASAALSFFHLKDFTKGRDSFFLSNLKYEYTESAVTDETPVQIVGYIGYGGDKIVVPNEVEGHPVVKVKAEAFKNNKVIEQLTVSSGVEIEASAFENCDKLKTVVFYGESNIGASAFADCDKLKKVEAENVHAIGERAFYSCNSLSVVRIASTEDQKNEGVVRIGASAFADCGAFEQIYIDRYVEYGENCAYFAGATRVDDLFLKNYDYATYDIGSPANKPLAALFGYGTPSEEAPEETPEEGGEEGEEPEEPSVEPTETVWGANATASVSVQKLRIEHIDAIPEKFALYCEKALESVSIDNLKDSAIGEEAFFNCSKLSVLKLPKLATSVGAYALANTALTELNGTALLSIGEGAFSDCVHLRKIELAEATSIACIEDFAFDGCSALEEILIPATVEYIGFSAFADCESLKTLNFAADCALDTIYDMAFEDCTALRTVLLPSGVTTVGTQAFYHCSSLRYLSLPASLTSLASDSLELCYRLHEIENLSTAVSVTAGSGVGQYTLKVYGATEDVEARIPKHTVGDYIIGDVDGVHYLLEYTGGGGSITLPIGVNGAEYTVVSYLFYETSHVSELKIPSAVCALGEYVFHESAVETVRFISGENALDFETYTFKNCANLVSVDFGTRGVTTLEEGAFGGCTSLKSATLPASLESIGANAFEGLNSLVSVTGGTGVVTIGANAFNGCEKLERYGFAAALRNIGNSAFYGCKKLQSVAGATELENIGSSTFAECSTLASLPLAESVRYIGDMAFVNCTSIVTVSGADALVSLGESAFEGCSALASLPVWNGLASLGDGAFKYCSALTYFYVSSALSSIPTSAFQGCKALRSVGGAENVSSIGADAFNGCAALETFRLCESVTSIGSAAFQNCTALRSVEGAESVSVIGANAFNGCASLETFWLYENVTSIGSDAFSNCPKLYEIYNLSDFDLAPNGTDNGYVAYNAVVVHTSATDNGLQTRKIGNYEFRYYNGEQGAWWTLVGYTGTATELVLDGMTGVSYYSIARYAFQNNAYLQKLTIGGAVTGMRSEAFTGLTKLTEIWFDDDVSITSVESNTFVSCGKINAFVIPTKLASVASNAFDTASSYRVYYRGTAWRQYDGLSGGSWYYYDECIHDNENMKWHYGNATKTAVTTAQNGEWYVTSRIEATCTLNGTEYSACHNCSDTKTTTLFKAGHSYSNGVCTRCTHIKDLSVGKSTLTTAERLISLDYTYGGYDVFGTDAAQIRSSGVDGKTVTIRITALEAVRLSLKFGMIGENCALEYTVYHGYGYTMYSGTLSEDGDYRDYSNLSLSANSYIEISFSKEVLTEEQEFTDEDGNTYTEEVEKENPAYAYIENITLTQVAIPSDTRN